MLIIFLPKQYEVHSRNFKIRLTFTGQFDLDCDNGNQVCCFNGCVTTCGVPKVCKTIYETKFENATKVMCSLVEQPPQCDTITSEECNDVTQIVEEIVTSQVEEEVCTTVEELACETVDSTVCVPPEYVTGIPVCPVVHLKPEDECATEEPSSCWSPGNDSVLFEE